MEKIFDPVEAVLTFIHEIVVSGLNSGDITIGDMLVYEYTWTDEFLKCA